MSPSVKRNWVSARLDSEKAARLRRIADEVVEEERSGVRRRPAIGALERINDVPPREAPRTC